MIVMKKLFPSTLLLYTFLLLPALGQSQNTAELSKDEKAVLAELDQKTAAYNDIAQQIWSWAELGYLEEKSAGLLQKTLEQEGFRIQKGVADIPTAFVASYGTGQPVIALMGEFDALPGVTQDRVPF